MDASSMRAINLAVERHLYYLAEIGVLDSFTAIQDDTMRWAARVKESTWRFSTHDELKAFSKGILAFAKFAGLDKKYRL